MRRYTGTKCSSFYAAVYAVIGAALALIAVTIAFIVTTANMPAAVPAEPQEEKKDTVNAAAEAVATEYAYYIPPDLYTEADAEALARMAWGESRGVGSLSVGGKVISGTCQKAATMWCALNRYDQGFEDSIAAVVAAPEQFIGYDPEHPLDDELLMIAYDVLARWEQEQLGGTDVGRVLPADYLYFTGDGVYNYFVRDWQSQDYYTWDLPDVYEGVSE